MTTAQDVVAAAADVVRGSRLERARAGMTTLNLFTQLSPDDKRSLAVLVAQHAAPQLVPRIQAEAGMDMTAEQSRAVLDMVRRLDGDDLAEIQQALGSSDGRRAAMASVTTAAAAAAGVDDVVRAPTDDDTVRAPIDDTTSEQDRARIRVLEDRIDHLTEQVADARRDATDAEARARAAEGELQASSARADEADHRLDDVNRSLEDARRRMRQADARARAAEAEGRRAEMRASASTPVARAVGPLPGAHGSTPAVGTEVDGLVGRLSTVSTSAGLRMVAAAAAVLASASPTQRLQVVTALPDGWARRKAIQRLVEAGAVPADEAPAMLARLASPGNQVFAAGSMLDAGLIDLGDVAGALTPSAATRLARRVR